MKRILLMCFMLVIAFVLVGCNNENEKINVEFILNETSTSVEIDKGTILTNDIVPIKNKGEVIGLYYDENKSKTYNDEPMNEDLTIYVKIIIEDLEKHLEKNENDDLVIKEAYCKFMNRLPNSPYVPSDFNIKHYFGKLNENQYVVVMENDIRMHTMEYPNMFADTYFVGSISFKYLPEIICIIFDGEYYDICDAYESKIISLDDVKIIKQIYDSVVKE